MLLLVFLTLIPLPVTAQDFGGAVWKRKELHVYDYSPVAWDGIFAQTVDDANAILPPRAPRVIYHRMPEMNCADAPIKRGAVVICQGSPERWPPFLREMWGMTWFPTEKRHILWSRVEINEQRGRPSRRLACHELIGHAILGLHDDYNSKTPAESCIHASAESPGTWDQAVARWLYKKFDKPHKN